MFSATGLFIFVEFEYITFSAAQDPTELDWIFEMPHSPVLSPIIGENAAV